MEARRDGEAWAGKGASKGMNEWMDGWIGYLGREEGMEMICRHSEAPLDDGGDGDARGPGYHTQHTVALEMVIKCKDR